MTRVSAVVPAVVAVLLVTGCGLTPEAHPQVLGSEDAPPGVNRVPSPAAIGTHRVLIYLSRDNVLVAVPRLVAARPDPTVVLQALVAGPTRREQDAGLVSSVLRASVGDTTQAGVVTVEVPAPDASSSGRTDEVLGFAQIVLTLTSLSSVTGVTFARDGRELAVPRGDGSLTPAVLTRRDYSSLL